MAPAGGNALFCDGHTEFVRGGMNYVLTTRKARMKPQRALKDFHTLTRTLNHST